MTLAANITLSLAKGERKQGSIACQILLRPRGECGVKPCSQEAIGG